MTEQIKTNLKAAAALEQNKDKYASLIAAMRAKVVDLKPWTDEEYKAFQCRYMQELAWEYRHTMYSPYEPPQRRFEPINPYE
jgi:hypothetical protein